MQVPKESFKPSLKRIDAAMKIRIPYQDPLTIPVTFAASEISWGDAKEIDMVQLYGKAA